MLNGSSNGCPIWGYKLKLFRVEPNRSVDIRGSVRDFIKIAVCGSVRFVSSRIADIRKELHILKCYLKLLYWLGKRLDSQPIDTYTILTRYISTILAVIKKIGKQSRYPLILEPIQSANRLLLSENWISILKLYYILLLKYFKTKW